MLFSFDAPANITNAGGAAGRPHSLPSRMDASLLSTRSVENVPDRSIHPQMVTAWVAAIRVITLLAMLFIAFRSSPKRRTVEINDKTSLPRGGGVSPMASLVDGKGLLVDHFFGAPIRTEARRRRGRCLPLCLEKRMLEQSSRGARLTNRIVPGWPYLCGFGFAKVGHSSLGRGSFSFHHRFCASFSQDFPPDARCELAQPGRPSPQSGHGRRP